MPYVTNFLRNDDTLIKSVSSVSIRSARAFARTFLEMASNESTRAEIRDSTSGVVIDRLPCVTTVHRPAGTAQA